jgi:hypothetical protein
MLFGYKYLTYINEENITVAYVLLRWANVLSLNCTDLEVFYLQEL